MECATESARVHGVDRQRSIRHQYCVLGHAWPAVYEALPPPPGPVGFGNGIASWAPDGLRLAVVSQPGGGIASIWIVEPEGPQVYRKLIELPAAPRVRGLAWTSDGSALIIGKREISSDIVLLDSAK
jgi:hypothetical protein